MSSTITYCISLPDLDRYTQGSLGTRSDSGGQSSGPPEDAEHEHGGDTDTEDKGDDGGTVVEAKDDDDASASSEAQGSVASYNTESLIDQGANAVSANSYETYYKEQTYYQLRKSKKVDPKNLQLRLTYDAYADMDKWYSDFVKPVIVDAGKTGKKDVGTALGAFAKYYELEPYIVFNMPPGVSKDEVKHLVIDVGKCKIEDQTMNMERSLTATVFRALRRPFEWEALATDSELDGHEREFLDASHTAMLTQFKQSEAQLKAVRDEADRTPTILVNSRQTRCVGYNAADGSYHCTSFSARAEMLVARDLLAGTLSDIMQEYPNATISVCQYYKDSYDFFKEFGDAHVDWVSMTLRLKFGNPQKATPFDEPSVARLAVGMLKGVYKGNGRPHDAARLKYGALGPHWAFALGGRQTHSSAAAASINGRYALMALTKLFGFYLALNPEKQRGKEFAETDQLALYEASTYMANYLAHVAKTYRPPAKAASDPGPRPSATEKKSKGKRAESVQAPAHAELQVWKTIRGFRVGQVFVVVWKQPEDKPTWSLYKMRKFTKAGSIHTEAVEYVPVSQTKYIGTWVWKARKLPKDQPAAGTPKLVRSASLNIDQSVTLHRDTAHSIKTVYKARLNSLGKLSEGLPGKLTGSAYMTAGELQF